MVYTPNAYMGYQIYDSSWTLNVGCSAGSSFGLPRHFGYTSCIALIFLCCLLMYSYNVCTTLTVQFPTSPQVCLKKSRYFFSFVPRNYGTLRSVQQHLPERMARCLPISKKLILKQLDKPFKRATERSKSVGDFVDVSRFGFRGDSLGDRGTRQKRRGGKTWSFAFNWNHHHCMAPKFQIFSESRSIQPISMFDIAFMNRRVYP